MSLSSLTRRHFLLAIAPLLAACAGGPAARKFSLDPLPASKTQDGARWSLAIAMPKALKFLDSERIAHRPQAMELQYYAGADWVDRAPPMLQMLMIRSFQNRSQLQVAAADQPGPPPDFLLTTLLQDFQSERQADGRISVHIALVASLTRARARQTSRDHLIDSCAESADDRIESVVAAFDQALAKAMEELVAWTLEHDPQNASHAAVGADPHTLSASPRIL